MKYVSEMENVCNRRKVYWLADGCADMGIQNLNPMTVSLQIRTASMRLV